MKNEIERFDEQYRHSADCVLSESRWFYPEQAFRLPVENLLIATVRYDRNLCCIYASPAYLQIIACKWGKMPGKSVDEFWWPTNISAKAYRAVLEEVMISGKESEVTLEWTDEDRRLTCYIEKLVPEYDTYGKIVGVSALVIDISDLRLQQMIENNRQRVFERLAQGDNLTSILEQVALYLESAKPDVYCSILLLDEEQKHLQMIVAPSIPEPYRAIFDSQLLAMESECCPGWVASARQAERVIVDDFSKHSCFSSCRTVICEMGLSACWFEPILSSTKQLQGVLCLYLKQAGVPDQDDSALLLQASYLSALSIERKRLEQQIYNQACYDPLTNLPNRRLFCDRLHEEIIKAERGNYGLAVVFIDLDYFKKVNDGWGHEAGDGLLVEVAQRIQTCVREYDTVARLGGDEFVIILPEVGNTRLIQRVAQNVISVMQQPFYYGEHCLCVSASVGIAVYPANATHTESLINFADQAMYAAKEAGRNTYRIFT